LPIAGDRNRVCRVPLAIAHAAPQLRIDGIDLSPAMIAAAQRDCTAAGLDQRVTFEVADVAGLPYPDAMFDLVASSMSLHHWSDPSAAMRDLRRGPAPAGTDLDLRRPAGATPAAWFGTRPPDRPAPPSWSPIPPERSSHCSPQPPDDRPAADPARVPAAGQHVGR
jgi:SAM-dependent methyltransferase